MENRVSPSSGRHSAGKRMRYQVGVSCLSKFSNDFFLAGAGLLAI